MKKILFALVVLLVGVLSSCKTGTFTSEYGKEDIAYVFLTSSGDMAGKTVLVQIDDANSFEMKVRKAKQSTEKHNGKAFSIMPGTRHMKITYKGQLIYEKDIFVSSQQTKLINL